MLGAFTGYLETHFALFSLLSGPLTTIFGFTLTTLVFGLLFKVIPDVEVTWGDVLIGALATAGSSLSGGSVSAFTSGAARSNRPTAPSAR